MKLAIKLCHLLLHAYSAQQHAHLHAERAFALRRAREQHVIAVLPPPLPAAAQPKPRYKLHRYVQF